MSSNYPSGSGYCYHQFVQPFENLPSYSSQYVNLTNQSVDSLTQFCQDIVNLETKVANLEWYREIQTGNEGYNKPMVLIGVYISIATLFCVLAMTLDLLHGFRSKKFWFPCKMFALNAASITVVTVAMKLPVDLTSPMPGMVDQVAKFGGMAFMCTVMSNFMPSLASMDNKSLVANVTGLTIFVITMVVNIFIQLTTHVVNPNMFGNILTRYFRAMVTYVYAGMLLFLLVILISSSIALPTTKKILELKYQATSKILLNDNNPQENKTSTLEQVVKRYWIMVETGSPQFVMASNPLSSAVGITCTISMVIYVFFVLELFRRLDYETYESVYKRSMIPIVVTQSIGIVVGSIAPIFRCFTLLSFKSFSRFNRNHFLVSKVENYWTEKLCEWKQSRISHDLSSHKSTVVLDNLKNPVLSFCIGFQKVIIVLCRIIRLIPIVVIIFVVYLSSYLKSVKDMVFDKRNEDQQSNNINEDLSNYVLLLEYNMQLAEKTVMRISDSFNRLIQKAEKKQHNNLLKLLEESVAFDGVEAFDNEQVPSILSVELVNTWSLPVISLTCIAIAIPNIQKDRVDNLLESVGEGLVYTNLVDESFNRESVYVNLRRATVTAWHEVEDKCMWLENSLGTNGYEGKTPRMIIGSFGHNANEIVKDFKETTNAEFLDKDNLPPRVIIANSMYRIAETIIHTYESKTLEIIEDELFTWLSRMIADILAACLTNIPRVVIMRCNESVIEKRESSVMVAIELLGRTKEIIRRLETRELPDMDHDKMGFIDEWRLHLRQP